MIVQIVNEEGTITRTVFNVRSIAQRTDPPRADGDEAIACGFELAMEFSDTPVIVPHGRTLRVVESEGH